jgi:hypothetical protein
MSKSPKCGNSFGDGACQKLLKKGGGIYCQGCRSKTGSGNNNYLFKKSLNQRKKFLK